MRLSRIAGTNLQVTCGQRPAKEGDQLRHHCFWGRAVVLGLGKTHLAQAIGNEVKRNHSNRVVLYVSSEKFINQFIDHSRNNAINDFIHFYQLIDVLIIDDVQFFNKAEKSQDALFAIFNHLHQCGKQLMLTSDKSPKDLEGVQERLLSRFRWGLSADLQIPDYETKIEILKEK